LLPDGDKHLPAAVALERDAFPLNWASRSIYLILLYFVRCLGDSAWPQDALSEEHPDEHHTSVKPEYGDQEPTRLAHGLLSERQFNGCHVVRRYRNHGH
jgi:hypothetical protein